MTDKHIVNAVKINEIDIDISAIKHYKRVKSEYFCMLYRLNIDPLRWEKNQEKMII